MENMPAIKSNTWFLAKLAREANAAELAFASCHEYLTWFVSINGSLNTFFIKAR